MKKIGIIIAFAATLICTDRANAIVKVEYGIRGGVNLGTASKASYTNQTVTATYDLDHNTGYHLGFTTRLTLLKLITIQPEILYNHSAFNATLRNPSSYTGGIVPPSSMKLTGNNINVPVLFGLKLTLFRLYGGPVFNVWNKFEYSGDDPAYKDPLNKYPSVGYQVGAGVSVWKLDIDVRFNGLGKGKNDPHVRFGNGSSMDFRHNSFMISAGLMF